MKIEKLSYTNDSITLQLADGSKLQLPLLLEYSRRFSSGTELSSEELSLLKNAADGYLCRKSALKYVGAANHSEAEIRRHLAKKKFAGASVVSALEYLKENKLINDREFALRCARTIVRSKAAGERLIRESLAKKGLDRETVNLTINALGRDAEDPEKAYTAAEKKLASLAGKKNLCAKIVYFLQSRGYSSKTVYSTIEKLKNAGHRFDDVPGEEE